MGNNSDRLSGYVLSFMELINTGMTEFKERAPIPLICIETIPISKYTEGKVGVEDVKRDIIYLESSRNMEPSDLLTMGIEECSGVKNKKKNILVMAMVIYCIGDDRNNIEITASSISGEMVTVKSSIDLVTGKYIISDKIEHSDISSQVLNRAGSLMSGWLLEMVNNPESEELSGFKEEMEKEIHRRIINGDTLEPEKATIH